jgi:hypothetical protein
VLSLARGSVKVMVRKVTEGDEEEGETEISVGVGRAYV